MSNRMLLDRTTQLETGRMILRPYRRDDGPCLYAASQRNREHFERYESGNFLMKIHTEEEAETLARELAAAWTRRAYFVLGIWDKASGMWAGQVYVGPIDWCLPHFEMGYVADVDHEGRGLISEAVRAVLRMLFKTMGAHRVQIRCDDTNERSARVAERCGFAQEGHLREDKRHPDGSVSGTLVYRMLRSDWQALHGRPIDL